VWRRLWAVTPSGSGVCLCFASSSSARATTGRMTRSRALSLSRRLPVDVGKTKSLGFAPAQAWRWLVSSSRSAGRMSTRRIPATGRQPLRCELGVLAELGLKLERQLDLAQARLGLRLADAQAPAVEVEPCARQLGDPRAREAERRKQRSATVLLVRREAALPFVGDVEQVDRLVGLEERPAGLRDLHPPPTAPGWVRVEQAVLDGVVEDRGEQIERHVHRSRRQAAGVQLLPEVVDAAGVDRRCRRVRKMQQNVVESPAVVELRVLGQLALAALPPARGGDVQRLVAVELGRRLRRGRLPRATSDLTHDAFQLDTGALLVPALVVRAEVDAPAPPLGAEPSAEGDRPPSLHVCVSIEPVACRAAGAT